MGTRRRAIRPVACLLVGDQSACGMDRGEGGAVGIDPDAGDAGRGRTVGRAMPLAFI